MESATSAHLKLLCRVGQCQCALPLEHVDETMRPLPTEPLGGAPSFVLGLAIIRGIPTPVLHLGRLLGLEEAGTVCRFVTLRVGERRVALAVDEVVDVRWLRAEEAAEVPPLLRHGSLDGVTAIAALDRQLLLVLQGIELVPESVWELTGTEPSS